VSSSNQLQWNGEPVSDRAALEARLQAAAQEPVQPEIHVHADPKTKYDAVAAVLTAAQRQGLLKIGVVGLEAYAKPAL
jgi:biopolymer transport protein ExbD